MRLMLYRRGLVTWRVVTKKFETHAETQGK
jgi:hypothetical protein